MFEDSASGTATAAAAAGVRAGAASPPPPEGHAPSLPHKGTFAPPMSAVPSAAFGGGGERAAGGGGDDDDENGALPVEFLAADLSKIFRASQERVEHTLTAESFYR